MSSADRIRELENALEEERGRTQALMDLIPAGISWLREDLTYIRANLYVSEKTNTPRDVFLRGKWGASNRLEFDRAALEKFLQSEDDTADFLAVVRQDDGSGRRHRLLWQKLKNRHEIIVVGLDIENELSAHERMFSQSKLASLGEMAGGVAHEINTPLAAIQLLSGQLEALLASDPVDREKIKNIMETVEQATERIANIVKGLLFFSREGSADPMCSESVEHIVEDTLSLCQEKFKIERISIRRIPAPSSVAVVCRRIEVSQILLNLLNNARDAVVSLPEKWIRIEVIEREAWVEIAVVDSGHGIPKKVQEKMFQPFFTSKEVGKGTGLGLSISAGLAKSNQGELSYDRQSDHTRFVLSLPKR